MPALLAALPLVCVLIGMVGLHLSALAAGLAGLAVAAFFTIGFVGPFDLAAIADGRLLPAAQGTLAEALHATGTIIWIIFPALVLDAFQRGVGAVERLRDALANLTANRRVQAILIAWFFGLFMEGAAGFGTPVALAAPLLYGMGYPPVRAVTLALLGHAAGVSFGAIGTPTLAQLELTGLDPQALAFQVALFHACLGWILLFAMVRLADTGAMRRADWGWTVLAGLTFFVPFLAFAFLAGPELPSMAGALVGLVLFVAMLKRAGSTGRLNAKQLAADLAPYLMIVMLILITRLTPPLSEALRAMTWDWSLHNRFSGSFAPLYHPGTLLWGGLIVGALVTGRLGRLPAATGSALQRLVSVTLALLVMLTLSRLMVQSGMIAALAQAAASTGPIWPILSPMVGVLGTFITGSATASNILFTDLQVQAAGALGLSTLVMVASQGFGSAIGNTIAPHNIIAGAATVGLVGKEGRVLRQTAFVCALYTVLGGIGVLLALEL